jgi:lipopolysaccharide/colanic/teichoic acid biosynthesis glycosyltransferase/glycosyltransferase involved in cell wall biosynthesis
MHVLYFHQHFTTPDGSSGTRSYEVSKQLLASGHRVTMVCGAAALSKSGLSGPFLQGRRRGVVDGINVIELELPYSNYDSFPQRCWTFMRYAMRSVMLALQLDCDLIFATSTPLTAALPGIAARWLRRKPFVFEVRDLWPELPRAMGVLRNPVALLLLDWLEFVAYHSANSCVALSPGIAQGVLRRGVPGNRIVLAPNGCDLDLFAPDRAQALPKIPGLPSAAFVAAFTGAHGVANGLGAVLDGAAELRKRQRNDIFLVLMGDGREKPTLMERAKNEKLENCTFVDPMPKKALAQFLCRRANVGLMILANVPAFYYGTSPNKFFDYLASGLPVLVNYPGWVAEMVAAEKVGVVVPPQDPSAFADALMGMADSPAATAAMGLRAHDFAKREFLQTTLAQRCVALIEEVTAGLAKIERLDRPRVQARKNPRMAKDKDEDGERQRMSAYRRWGKRSLDMAVLSAALPFVLPLGIVLALLVWLQMDSPVLFRQVRPGFKARPFTLLKFRTMSLERDERGHLLSDEKRLTHFGKFLRRYSLDEIPQFWNVLNGEMSFVGPRPLLTEYLERYTPDEARRHQVKPGITGWAQINGRNAITWKQKFVLDQWYVDHRSLWLDVKILLKTIGQTLTSRGISQPGHATAEEFWGGTQ